MQLIERIRAAQTKKDLDILVIEIILSANHKECTEAFKARLGELENMAVEEHKGHLERSKD